MSSQTLSSDLLGSEPFVIADDATPLERALPGETIHHSWMGAVGPRPSLLSTFSFLLLLGVFAHLVIDLPDWWPYVAGAFAIAVNLLLAVWQAGSYRVVAVTDSGIHVLRKARWSTSCTGLVGSMPRMPLGPVKGRWCKMSIANTVMWVHRRDHRAVARFDRQYRGWFQARLTSADINIPVRER